MIVILIGYIAIVSQWVTLYILHQQAPQEWQHAKRSTWWLFVASILVGVALIYNWIWLSLLGMLCALTAVSFIFQVLTNWLRKKTVSHTGIIVWLEWLFVFSVTLAHFLVITINYLHEAAR